MMRNDKVFETESHTAKTKGVVILEDTDPQELLQFLESIQLHYPSKYQIAYLDRLVVLARAAFEGSLNTESTSSD